jgi:hypothetical protein
MPHGRGLGATLKTYAAKELALFASRKRRRVMSRLSFDTFFRNATGNLPYGYQCRLACGQQANLEKPQTLQTGTTCHSQLINVPTGLGK